MAAVAECKRPPSAARCGNGNRFLQKFFSLFGLQLHIEMWLSLVERHVRDVEVAGSNPVISTKGKGTPSGVPFPLVEAAPRAWLLQSNDAGSVSPAGDRRACTPGAGCAKFRRRRISCHFFGSSRSGGRNCAAVLSSRLTAGCCIISKTCAKASYKVCS